MSQTPEPVNGRSIIRAAREMFEEENPGEVWITQDDDTKGRYGARAYRQLTENP